MPVGAAPQRLLVTRPAAQVQAWVDGLQALGVPALGLPLIGIEPLADPSPLRAAWGRLPEQALLVFVSANAVDHFFAARPPAAAWPDGTLAASTGPGTSAALRRQGLKPDQVVEPPDGGPYESETLWPRLQPCPWQGAQVQVVRGESGRDWLAAQFEAAGAKVEFVNAYRRTLPRLSAAEAALLAAAQADPAQHGWLFSSGEAARHLQQLAAGADWSAASAIATHPRVATAVRALGFARVVQAAPSLVDVATAWCGLGGHLQSSAT